MKRVVISALLAACVAVAVAVPGVASAHWRGGGGWHGGGWHRGGWNGGWRGGGFGFYPGYYGAYGGYGGCWRWVRWPYWHRTNVCY